MKAFLQKAALLLGSSLLVLAGIELMVRLLGNDTAISGNQYVFYHFDPVLGWNNTPGATGTYSRVEFSHPIQNNRLGMRDAEISPKAPGEIRVAVLGDSFTWGIGAAYGERFTEVMEDREPTLNVLNFGVSGYGTVQESLLLDAVLEQQPDFVVVAFCLGNDLLDNVYPFRYSYHKPTASLNANGHAIISTAPLRESKQFGGTIAGAASRLRLVGIVRLALRRHAEKARIREQGGTTKFAVEDPDLYLPDTIATPEVQQQRREAMDVAVALLRDMNAKVTAALGSGRFVVLFVPTKFETGTAREAKAGSKPNLVGDELRSRLRAVEIMVIDGRAVIGPDDFWARDGHWNRKGHEKIATLVSAELKRMLAVATGGVRRQL